MSYRLEFTLHGLPSSPNSRRHWRLVHKENESWYRSIYLAVGDRRPLAPCQFAQVTLTRISALEPDYDNLCASFKPVLDGLRYARVLIDDKKKNVGRPEYLWERGKGGKGSIRVLVEEVEPGKFPANAGIHKTSLGREG